LTDDKDPLKNYLWNRWGRVGVPGQSALKGPMGLPNAIAEFSSKLYDKTRKGNYVKIEINNENEENEETKKETKKPIGKKIATASKVDPRLQNLLSLLFDMNLVNS
jgi:poly [ADP-ribose] polymerase